jgi:ribose transport system permease protein
MTAATVSPDELRVNPGTPAVRYALRVLKRHSFVFALILSVVFFVINTIQSGGDLGLTAQLANLAPTAVAAMASAPAIISGRGGFDLSISPSMVLCSGLYAAYFVTHGIDGPAAIALMLLVGAGIGLVNGALIVGLRIPPVVATLSMYFILLGVNLKVIENPISLSGSPLAKFAGSVGPVPGALFTLAFPLVVWGLLGLTRYRSTLFAVGSNDITAYSAGINVGLVRVGAYALGGLFAGVAGVAIIAVSSSANANLSGTYALPAVASVALGGTSLLGGRGGLFGPLLGAASIFLLGNILISFQVNPSWLQVVYGVMLMLSVVLVAYASRATSGVVK